MRSTLLAVWALALPGSVIVRPLAAQQKPPRQSPTLVTNPGAPTPAAPPAAAPADTGSKSRRPPPTLVNRPGVTVDSSRTAARGAAANQAVAPQAARPRGPVAAYTAGLAMEPYSAADEAGRQRYIAQFTQRLDSTIATLIGVFRGTTGQPLAGAEAPTALSQRERDRWARCRDLHYDLQSYATAMHDLVGELPDEAPVQRAGEGLDSALTALRATSGCDDVSSMIAAPDRWTPWASQYQTTARTFYRDWYPQARDAADRNRALVIALNATLPAAERVPVPPGIARTAPYAGAGPR